MPLLQVRDCPQAILDELARRAAAEKRSVPKQTIVELEGALNVDVGANRVRRMELLRSIDKFRESFEGRRFLDAVDLIREDRDR